jgi:hypothetical protein
VEKTETAGPSDQKPDRAAMPFLVVGKCSAFPIFLSCDFSISQKSAAEIATLVQGISLHFV